MRDIGETGESDAVGPYPLFCCADWSGLPADLEKLADDVVSVVLVIDPFGPDDLSTVAGAFSHGLVAYKNHHVIDLAVPLAESVSAHHRRNVRQSLAQLTVERLAAPRQHLGAWCELYEELIRRHQLTGVSRFSREAFSIQLSVPGLVAFRAVSGDGQTVGMVLWYCQGEVGYYHLAAYSPPGYDLKASYCAVLGKRAAARRKGAVAELGRGGRRDVRRVRRTDAFQEGLDTTCAASVPRPACCLPEPLHRVVPREAQRRNTSRRIGPRS